MTISLNQAAVQPTPVVQPTPAAPAPAAPAAAAPATTTAPSSASYAASSYEAGDPATTIATAANAEAAPMPWEAPEPVETDEDSQMENANPTTGRHRPISASASSELSPPLISSPTIS